MISPSVIPEEVYSRLPDDPDERFLMLVDAARKTLERALASEEEDLAPYNYEIWRRQYLWEIAFIAEEMGITGLPSANSVEGHAGKVEGFEAKLTQIITRLRLRVAIRPREDTVALSVVTKAHIGADLQRLRATINAAAISDHLRASLHKRVDAVEAELAKQRSGMVPLWVLLGALNFAQLATGTLADLPDAMETMKSIAGRFQEEKARELEHEDRLSAPLQITSTTPKQIADQREG